MDVIRIIVIYFIIINLIGFMLMGVDKYKAKNSLWRIPEATLFIIAIIGGSIGSILGMYTFRHKTRHMRFVIGMPMILILQVLLFVLIVNSSLQIGIM